MAARETGLRRALVMAARQRKGRGSTSATPSSRHPSTTRAAIGPDRGRAGRPMGSCGLCCCCGCRRANSRRAVGGACAERGWRRLSVGVSVTHCPRLFCCTRAAARAAPLVVPCRERPGLPGRPGLSAQEGAGSPPWPGEAGG